MRGLNSCRDERNNREDSAIASQTPSHLSHNRSSHAWPRFCDDGLAGVRKVLELRMATKSRQDLPR